jgi:hypothetical protein
MTWVARRTTELGNTPAARAQAQTEWQQGHALLEGLKRLDQWAQDASRRKAWGRGGMPIEFDGEVRTLSGWARHLGLLKTTLHERIKRWGLDRALRTPARRHGC